MNVVWWWDDIEGGTPKSPEKDLVLRFICRLQRYDYSSVYVVLLSQDFFKYNSHVK
jgi:hypothetical protein